MTQIDTRVTSALHDENITKLDGYGEITAPLLAPVAEALSDAYITLGKLHDARDAARKNQVWTQAQQVIAISDTSFKQQQRLLKKFENISGAIDKQILYFEGELQAPLESKAVTLIATEIRRHVKDMPTEKRHAFLRQAISEGDQTTMSSVLGAPSYLSGLESGFSASYTRLWNEKMNPDVAQKLKAVRSAKSLVERSAPLIMTEVEKAMGMNWGEVSGFRKLNDNALNALKFGVQ